MKKKKENAPNYVYLSYEESDSGGEPMDGESGPYCSREPEYREWKPISISSKNPDEIYLEEVLAADFIPDDMIGKWIYLVVVRYETGNTFGRSYGHAQPIACYADMKSAEKMAKLISDDKYTQTEDFPYCNWRGYFERLEDVEIHKMTVDADPSDVSDGIKRFY